MKLKGKLSWLTMGATVGILAGGAGIGMAIYATHKVSGTNGVDDLKIQLDKKSDIADNIIQMDDHLKVVKKYGALLGIEYQNEETKQVVSFVPIKFDTGSKKAFQYMKTLNVYSRLQRRGEKFVGTLEAEDKIQYIFRDGPLPTSPIIKIVEFIADADGGKYSIATDHTNEKIIFSVSEGTTMKVAASLAGLQDANVTTSSTELTYNKKILFAKGNIPSVSVKFINNEDFDLDHLGTSINELEMMRLKYYSHVGYAFQRGISAGEAVFQWLDHKVEELTKEVEALKTP